MRKDKNFRSFCLALGEKDDKVTMNISKFSPSSSLIAKPADSYEQVIEMQMLDNFSGLIENKGTVIVKMDVEGYEYSILKGGKKIHFICRLALYRMQDNRCDRLYIQ